MKRINAMILSLMLTTGIGAQVNLSIGPDPVAPQGCIVCCTISNDFNFNVVMGNPCPVSVRTSPTGPVIWTALCAQIPQTIPAGGIYIIQWDQTDSAGNQVALGTYTIEVNVPTQGLQQRQITIVSGAQAGISPLGVHKTGTTRPLVVCSPQDPNAGYLLAAALNQSPGFPLCPGVSVPLAFDFLTQLSLDPNNPFFNNFVGTLDSTGESPQNGPEIAIPNIPSLAGFSFHLCALVVTSGPCPLKVSNPYTVTIQ